MDREQRDFTAITVFVIEEDRVLPGDILLTRAGFKLVDKSTWKSKFIQRSTGTPYSHAALCIGFAMFIEALGPGVCRLAISQTGARDKQNVRLLRLDEQKVPQAEEKARAAAQRGEHFLLRGYSLPGAAGVKLRFLRDPQRAALFCSQLVARAYEEAGTPLVPDKTSQEISPGGLLGSPFLKDITSEVVRPLRTDIPPAFYLDDGSAALRPHQWEVQTKLKILYSKNVQRVLCSLKQAPPSFWELEVALAKSRSKDLDEAVIGELKRKRFAETYLNKIDPFFDLDELRKFGDNLVERSRSGEMSDDELFLWLKETSNIGKQLKADFEHRQFEWTAYSQLYAETGLKTFGYLLSLQETLWIQSKQLLDMKARDFQRLGEEVRRRRAAAEQA